MRLGKFWNQNYCRAPVASREKMWHSFSTTTIRVLRKIKSAIKGLCWKAQKAKWETIQLRLRCGWRKERIAFACRQKMLTRRSNGSKALRIAAKKTHWKDSTAIMFTATYSDVSFFFQGASLKFYLNYLCRRSSWYWWRVSTKETLHKHSRTCANSWNKQGRWEHESMAIYHCEGNNVSICWLLPRFIESSRLRCDNFGEMCNSSANWKPGDWHALVVIWYWYPLRRFKVCWKTWLWNSFLKTIVWT